LTTGLAFAALIVPVFIYRHYIQDKGSFPREMAEDLDMVDGEKWPPDLHGTGSEDDEVVLDYVHQVKTALREGWSEQ
jgi:hypothetical protein